MTKRALITGITGQDSSYLAELLVHKGYEVYGLIRRNSTDNKWRLKNVIDKIELVTGDLTDQGALNKAIQAVNPHEVYNLAAMSYVGCSWTNAEYTMNVNALGFMRLLEAIRSFGRKGTRVYQASTSEQFGKVAETPQKETTRFYPRSPYGTSKVAAHWIGVNYRESYNMFICMGICFNHESPRRGLEFLSKKVAHNVARVKLGLSPKIELGNLDAKRDWGFAGDYVDAMHLMLQQDSPDDFIIATGESHSVEEFVQEAFRTVDIENYKDFIELNPKWIRPAEVNILQGDYSKAKRVLGWEPDYKFKDLVKMMVMDEMYTLGKDA